MPEPETREPALDLAAQDPQTLEYEPQPPGRRARKWLVRIALFLVAVIAVEAGLYYYRDVSNWIALVRLRHEVMTHTLPARTPILTQMPSDSPANWLKLLSAHYGGIDPIWTAFERHLSHQPQAAPGSRGTVFLHGMRTPSGRRRVLAMHSTPAYAPANGVWMVVDVRLFDPGTFVHPRFGELTVKDGDLYVRGSIPDFPGICTSLGTVPWGSSFQLFAGQIDPADPSRFTIGYILNGKPGKFIGQLHDDDSISLRDANGTALPEHFPASSAKNTPTTRPG
jgi:hypothetical protein